MPFELHASFAPLSGGQDSRVSILGQPQPRPSADDRRMFMKHRIAYLRLIGGFFAGGIAGWTAASLWARRPGRAARERVARKVSEATLCAGDAGSALSAGYGEKLGRSAAPAELNREARP